MNSITRLFIFAIVSALLLTPAQAGGKKSPKGTFSFHLETQGGESKNMIFPQLVAEKKRFFRIIPEISTKDVVAFRTFPSETGDFGVVLQLTRKASQRLYAVSTANRGKWLLAQVNGQVLDAVIIDKPVFDGKLVVWKGISTRHIKILEEMLPHIGETRKEWQERIKK